MKSPYGCLEDIFCWTVAIRLKCSKSGSKQSKIVKMKVPLVVLILAGLLTVGVSGSEVFESEVDHASSNDHPQSIGRNRILPELAKKPAAGSGTGSDKDIIPLIDQEDQEDQEEGQFSVVDRVLLALLRDALGSLEGSRCRRDMNWTLDAIERKEPWAVASMFVIFIGLRAIFLIFLFFFRFLHLTMIRCVC